MKKFLFSLFSLFTLVASAQVCFNSPVNYTTPNDPWGICKGDFNGDGHIDVANTNRTNNQVSVFFGNGTGILTLNQTMGGSNTPEGIATGDFNNDGKPDLVVANNQNNQVTLFDNTGVGTFTMSSQWPTANSPKRVIAADFDQNGFMDIAASCQGSSAVTVLINDGAGNFSMLNVSVGNGPIGLCTGDFNNDNNLDFATSNQGSNNISVARGLGDGTFMPINNYNTGGSGQFGITSTSLDVNGTIDLLVANAASNNVSVCLGPGNATYTTSSTVTVNSAPRAIAMGDFNMDGKLDAAVCAYASGEVHILQGDGTGGMMNVGNFPVGNSPRDLVVADLNEDGRPDIVTANLGSNNLTVLLNTLPTLSVTGASQPICYGSGGLLTASGADTYTWSANAGSATTATVAITPTASTSYTVTASSAGCGINLQSVVNVTVNPVPTVQTLPGGPSTICEGQSTSIKDVGDGINQIWMPGSLTGTLVVVSPTVTTTYTVTSSAGGTGCTSSGTIQVFVNPSPTVTINATATVVCSGSPVTLTASGASTYTWTGGISNGVVFSPTATVTYTVTATGSNSCTKTLTQLVNVNPLPTVSANTSATNICPGTFVTLTGSGTATTYTWTGGVTDGVAFPSTAQVYTVTGIDANNCAKTATISVTAPPPAAPAICMVTVDSLSINNVIIWDKTLYQNADTFVVYRDTANGNYVAIAKLPYSMLSQFTDTARSIGAVNGDPNITTYRYKLAFIDTCGVLSPKSLYHNSIYQYNISSLFLWNQYEIEGQSIPVPGLSNYVLKRDNLGATGNYTTAATAGASSTSINDPQYATYQAQADWRVETIWNITCTPTAREANGIQGSIVKSKSNIKNNRTTNVQLILDRLVSVYPNPTSGDLYLHFNSSVSGKLAMKVYSALGNEVYSKLLVNPSGDINIDMGSSENGIYMIQLSCDAGIITKKIIKN